MVNAQAETPQVFICEDCDIINNCMELLTRSLGHAGQEHKLLIYSHSQQADTTLNVKYR